MNANPQKKMPPRSVATHLLISDQGAAYWHSQVILRLRREVLWCWHQRTQSPDPGTGELPPLQNLGFERVQYGIHDEQKSLFFQNDDAAQRLSGEITALGLPPSEQEDSLWCWLADFLGLTEAAQFVMALGLAARVDAGLSPVISACMNDPSRSYPTPALAQRLWDMPNDVMVCTDSGHALFRFGLLTKLDNSGEQMIWQMPLNMPTMIARQFCESQASLPAGCTVVELRNSKPLDQSAMLLFESIKSKTDKMHIVPLLGQKDAAFDDWAVTLSQHLGCRLVRLDSSLVSNGRDMMAFASLCWMYGLDVLLPDEWLEGDLKEQAQLLQSPYSIPVRWYLPMSDDAQRQSFPNHLLTPSLTIEPLSYEDRLLQFRQGLGVRAHSLLALKDCVRRFRFQDKAIKRICTVFSDPEVPLNDEILIASCTNEAVVEMGQLAQWVHPRFCLDELILPDDQSRQLTDILHAMRSLTVVHYEWGTAKAWNESGLSVLFCGAPGTGKTMAAEVIANELKLPMFRIDLSQVVNKYIGETEKNLRRIFDAAELCDCILFFDEADALFGKRTEVKDAHDRFANIEISYLLERMERSKGLAILATNRRRDMDGAFMRRLRYMLEFPVPEAVERKRIWQQVFPESVDTSDLDFDFLARQFPISGGYIRSIAFNACLSSANKKTKRTRPTVLMATVVRAVKLELEKMDRSSSNDMFGPYAHLLQESDI